MFFFSNWIEIWNWYTFFSYKAYTIEVAIDIFVGFLSKTQIVHVCLKS